NIPNYGATNVDFVWSFTPTNASLYGAALAKAPAAASFKTSAQSASLASYGLSAGTYDVTVYAQDRNNSANTSNTVTGKMALLATIETDFSALKVYPNPWRSDKHGTKNVTFAHLPLGSTIKLFTTSGHQVKSITPNLDTATWDLTNDKGDKVASG